MKEKLFDCKYPIVEASMNLGSDLKLALAVADAGAFPSLLTNYIKDSKLIGNDHNELYEKLREFKKSTGSCNLILGIGSSVLSNLNMLKIINEFQVSHIELFPSNPNGIIETIDKICSDNMNLAGIKFLKKTAQIITRLYTPTNSNFANQFDAFAIKGKESGGRSGCWSVLELFNNQRAQLNIPLYPIGGIGTPEQVKHYIDNGAVAVGIGTLFAACEESPLSKEAKDKIVNSTIKDIVQTPDTNQNVIILGNTILESQPADWNRSDLLDKGLHGNGETGLMYVGHGINHVDRIRTVKETVEYLVSQL